MTKDIFDISIEEFDAPCERHEFSDEYRKIKEINLQKFKKNKSGIGVGPIIAAAAACLVIASPFVAKATIDGDVFERIWGTKDRENVESHEVTYYEAEKDSYYTIIYPEQEFVDVDAETADRLIGDCLTQLDYSVEVDGTTITLLSVVRDEYGAVIELTIEKEGGIDNMFDCGPDSDSDFTWFTEDSTFWFTIGGATQIYVDKELSTDEKLVCYCYTDCDQGLVMTVNKLPCTMGGRGEYIAANSAEQLQKETRVTSHSITCKGRAESVTFTNSEGGTINVSPITMGIEMGEGTGISYTDTYYIHTIYINYKDGTSYCVEDHNMNAYGISYSCEVEKANYIYACGDFDQVLHLFFNRLVDNDAIESIVVNDVVYTR
ncbi:MAG: hypothetical protein MJ166_09045 [Clostridia bacterium]|nr:hypothetical protein [Clostridia bacterium]